MLNIFASPVGDDIRVSRKHLVGKIQGLREEPDELEKSAGMVVGRMNELESAQVLDGGETPKADYVSGRNTELRVVLHLQPLLYHQQ